MSQITSIQLKRGYKATLENKLKGALKPLDGEPIYEIDTGKMKIGDGLTDYEYLPYFTCGEVSEQIVFGSRYEFPVVGEENKLYVAKDEHNNYIWNGSNYELISADQHRIDAGGADAIY